MIFNPEESIDFHGYTGPFIQYTYARIKSILRKGLSMVNSELSIEPNNRPDTHSPFTIHHSPLLKLEKELLIDLENYTTVIEQSGNEHDPSHLANYVYTIAKTFNSFYTEHSVMKAESEEKKQLRLLICEMTANVIASGMKLLGIPVPERM